MNPTKQIPTRGYMLDISRDKVPTMGTLRALVHDLATLGFNQLQLYTEHTFAYPGHERVWGLASPMIAEEIRTLDAHCHEHGIELVPCINTMGHWERWLQHPEYFQYAECPYGWRRPDGHGMPHGSTLAPTPESLRLLDELMTAYLPLFSSETVNIGGDEPWELGMGRSRERCEKEGRHAVYIDFLRQIIALAKRHKNEVLFWGDILLEKPDLWEPAESGTTALIWAYEAGHPFEEQVLALKKRGQRCILCPGTSTWNSLGGRLGNALHNIKEAAECAEKHNASGLLLTDWGDHGHHQPAILSLPAIITFAREGWNAEVPDEWMSFGNVSELMPLIMDLGSLFCDFEDRPPNRLPLTQVLTTPEADLSKVAAAITDQDLERAEKRIHSLRCRMESIASRALTHREFALVLQFHAHAIQRLRLHNAFKEAQRRHLNAECIRLIGTFEELWLCRNRVGGLHESSDRLRRALISYPTVPNRRPAWPPAG